ncbi:hypothetical protein HA402_008733 [Bradysia odoriphaga]|nr:hypothetical protein HA402_008733 [Bradysia odoriphaga]
MNDNNDDLDELCVRFKYADQELLERRLGIPSKPKKPLNTYLRYFTDPEVRASVAAKHPTSNTIEQSTLIAKMWNSLDAAGKQKYFTAFADDTIVYRQKLAEYYGKITEDDKRKIHTKQMELKEEIEKRRNANKQRKKAIALDRPKQPLAGYMKFFSESKDRKPNETCSDFTLRKTAEWKCLSVSQKAAFNAPVEDIEKFK